MAQGDYVDYTWWIIKSSLLEGKTVTHYFLANYNSHHMGIESDLQLGMKGPDYICAFFIFLNEENNTAILRKA